MTTNLRAETMMAYLEEVCQKLDRGEPLRRPRSWWRVGAAATLAAGLALGAGACGSEDAGTTDPEVTNADDALSEVKDADAKADGLSFPLGSYENKGTTGTLKVLVLRASDHSFSAKALDGSALEGTWEFTRAGSTRYLRLTVGSGAERYEYKFKDATLSLRKTKTNVWFDLLKMVEICGDGIDNDADGSIDCGDSDCTSQCGVKYGIPYEADCADGKDNDGDGTVDCADPDCLEATTCQGTKYGIPYEYDCDDDKDNDGDGLVDCSDTDCSSAPTCQGTKYGIPYEADCGDNLDNDSDGMVDCSDPDCSSDPGCQGVKYGIPYEADCLDGLDNDGDGLADCADADCAVNPGCAGIKYGIPYEADCTDGLDNDNDGKVDCLDADCADVPICQGVKYAAPQD